MGVQKFNQVIQYGQHGAGNRLAYGPQGFFPVVFRNISFPLPVQRVRGGVRHDLGHFGGDPCRSLERLERLVSAARRERGAPVTAEAAVQRIGLSATQRPLETVAGFLGGADASADSVEPRPVTV